MSFLKKIYKKSPDVVARELIDETVLVPVRRNIGNLSCIYSLNEVGKYVWDQLDSRKTLEQIKDKIAKDFYAPPKAIEKDLKIFIKQVEKVGAILQK